ncbi:hypothetical protein Ddye_017141 [Dipteronia dyeriana]|uniref:Reverse transcriptase domain-containing protein n=1 Tax=Dipteronia dyeriana TaxID=168575 RepID=A0AAD9X0X1_9ROSI|nr:hypothetical protein Ddye_017141 [Dipteronia dyeriana]
MIRGVNFGQREDEVIHIQFADDTILFLEPKVYHLINLRKLLRFFEMVSGLKVNFSKSCIAKVGKKVRVDTRWDRALRCKIVSFPIVYLGLPLCGNPNLKSFWNPVVEKIERRLAPWKVRFLTKCGRLVLIKAVFLSIPMFYMSVLRMPIGVTLKIEKLQRKFFWGDGIEKRKIHTINWAMASYFVKAVGSLYEKNDLTSKLLHDGFMVVLGRGDRIDFWTDVRWDSSLVKEYFPRIFTLSKKVHKFSDEKWVIPPFGALKFNIDGSARGKPVSVEIRGVLRDSSGRVLGLFSSYVRILESNTTEILAIHKACSLCASSSNLCDKSHLLSMKGLSVIFNPRSTNSFVDNLAKLGSSLKEDKLEWEL